VINIRHIGAPAAAIILVVSVRFSSAPLDRTVRRSSGGPTARRPQQCNRNQAEARLEVRFDAQLGHSPVPLPKFAQTQRLRHIWLPRNASLRHLWTKIAVQPTAPRAGKIALFTAALLSCRAAYVGAASVQPTGTDRSGVRHFITVTLSIAAAPNGPDQDQGVADLSAVVRILDHAAESQFFGEITVNLPALDPAENAPEKKIWEDPRCHQRRGFPKASVIAVNGIYTRDRSRLEANLRHIGLKLPPDEIVPSLSRTEGRDSAGRYSQLTPARRAAMSAVLKTYVIGCAL
jgi:hypothetical protein